MAFLFPMKHDMPTRRHRAYGAFLLLCLLLASEWTLEFVFPGSQSRSLFGQGIAYALLALAALPFSRRTSRLQPRSLCIQIAVTSVLFLGLPALVLTVVQGISSAVISALFTLTPAIVVLVAASLSNERRDLRSLLLPSLIGLAGALSVLPLTLPASFSGWITFVSILVIVILAAIAAVRLHPLMRSRPFVPALMIAMASNALLLLMWLTLRHEISLSSIDLAPQTAALVALRLMEALLILWLVREMMPIQFSARYTVIPFLSICEGGIIIHAGLTLRLIIGAVLLLLATCWLLFAGDKPQTETLSLR